VDSAGAEEAPVEQERVVDGLLGSEGYVSASGRAASGKREDLDSLNGSGLRFKVRLEFLLGGAEVDASDED
jgi:hypothetical protein